MKMKRPPLYRLASLFGVFVLPMLAVGQSRQTIDVHDKIEVRETLSGTRVNMSGRSELHITAAGNPIPNSSFHLDSPDAWLFFQEIRPSAVASEFLSQIQVDGLPAVLDQNVRVVQYEMGAMVIPHGPGFTPLEVFADRHFTGPSKALGLYTYHDDASLGMLRENISSFRLKRGYMATVAQREDGTGFSQNYVAQDGDIEVSILPSELDDQISFIRVFPWRWTGKKGYAGGNRDDANRLNSMWHYNWNNNQESTLDLEYVPIRHNRWWPGYATTNEKRGVTHVLAFNEPNQADQANMTVDQAIAEWPNLLRSGLRLGSPAPTDGGRDWLFEFMDRAEALDYRVDFVVVHFYRAQQSAQDLRNYLWQFYQRYGKPIWLKEFNNGANWTCCKPTFQQNASVIGDWIDFMDNAPWVERYSIYRWVEAERDMFYPDGWWTPAGEVYRDNDSPLAYRQVVPEGHGPDAHFTFDDNLLDQSGNGNNALLKGVPTFVPGNSGSALVMDGVHDVVQLPANLGDSANFSFAAWVNWDGGGNWQRVFDLGDGTNRYLALTPQSNANTLRFTIRNNGVSRQLEAPALIPGRWTHVAVTIGGGTGRLFVDGTLVSTNADMAETPAAVGTRWNYLGKSQFNADPLFAGRLDDVRFLSRVLREDEVAGIFANRAPAFTGDLLVKEDATVLAPYFSSIGDDATDRDGDSLVFARLGGPAWLTVAPDGNLTGIPGPADLGVNRFRVRISDAFGHTDSATVEIQVGKAEGLQAFYEFRASLESTVDSAHGIGTGSPGYVSVRRVPVLDLNGSSQYVTLPPEVANSDAITVATWLSWRGGADWQRIFDFGNGPDEYLYLTPSSGGDKKFRFGIRRGTDEEVLEAPAALPVGIWVHVAVTLAGGTGQLYLDGELVASGPIAGTPRQFRPANNFIGRSQFTADPLFDGSLRHFGIFNHALSRDEIVKLRDNNPPSFTQEPIPLPNAPPGQPYSVSIAGHATDPDLEDSLTFGKISGPHWLRVSASGSLLGTPAWTDVGTHTVTVRATDQALAAADVRLTVIVSGDPKLLLHYEFNGDTRDSAGIRDGSGQGTIGYAAGLFDQALVLNGTDTSVVLPNGFTSLVGTTIATRIRWNGGGDWQRIFEFGASLDRRLFLSPSVENSLQFVLLSPRRDLVLQTEPMQTGEWYHFAVTLEAESAALYVNGGLAGTLAFPGSAGSFEPISNYIGRSQTPDRFFDGRIDDFRIYQTVLSAPEVRALALSPFIQSQSVPDAFDDWAAGILFPPGENTRDSDPDGDRIANLLEYLFGGDPLVPGTASLPRSILRSGGELGPDAEPGKTYLTLQARVRQNRTGVVMLPQAAATLTELHGSPASENVKQAGPPQADGDFEIFTFYFAQAMEDSVGGKGFMHLKITTE